MAEIIREGSEKEFGWGPGVLIGLVGGLYLVWAFSMPPKWAYTLYLVALAPFLVVQIGHIERILLFLLVLAIPFVFSKQVVTGLELPEHQMHQGGPTGFVVSLVDLCVLGLLLAAFLRGYSRSRQAMQRARPRGYLPLTWWVLLMLGASALSLIHARDRVLVLYELVHFGQMLMIYFLFVYLLNTRRRLNLVVAAILLGMIAQGLIATAQMAKGGPLGLEFFGEGEQLETLELGRHDELSMRAGGTVGHPNCLATYLGLTVPVAFALLFAKLKSRTKYATIAALVLGLSAIVMTQSRGSWVGLAFSTATVLWLCHRYKLVSPRVFFAFVMGGVLVAVIMALVFAPMIYNRWFGSQPEAVDHRFELIDISWEVIKAYPIFGCGYNNFTEVMMEHNYTALPDAIKVPVHNVFLLTLAEWGIVGFIVFGFFVIYLIKTGVYVIKHGREMERLVVVGILAAYLAMLVHNLFDFTYRLDAVMRLFWVYAGIIGGLRLSIGAESRTRPAPLEEPASRSPAPVSG